MSMTRIDDCHDMNRAEPKSPRAAAGEIRKLNFFLRANPWTGIPGQVRWLANACPDDRCGIPRTLPVLRFRGSMQAYAKGKRVGHGTYGTVYRATHIETGTVVAIKKIRNANGVLSAEPSPLPLLAPEPPHAHDNDMADAHARCMPAAACVDTAHAPVAWPKSVVRLPHYA